MLKPEEHHLGAVAFAAHTDFHVTGGLLSESRLILGQNQPLELHLENAKLVASENGDVKVVVPSDTHVNITCSQHTLGIDGTLCTAMNGQTSILLKDVVKQTADGGSFICGASYCGWKSIASSVTFSKVHIDVKPSLDQTFGDVEATKLVFEDNDEKAKMLADAYKLLESLYDTSAQTRSEIVFQPAPNLTKPVMAVPFGINGSRFDISAAVCDRPQSFSDAALESLLMGGLKSACNFMCDAANAFLLETAVPSIHLASRWAVVAGDALSATNAAVCPYRVDGRSVLLPTGGDLLQSESWYSEAHRGPRAADDCEGSGSLIVSIANRCSEVARDGKLSEQYPVLRGIGNALRHHVVGLTVMAANAGNAEASGEDHSAVAGHAACIAISKPAFANAIKKGFECKLREAGHDQPAITKASSALVSEVFNALYLDDRKDLPSTPYDEQSITATTAEDVSEKILKLEAAAAGTSPVFDHVAAGPLVALGIEGTAPVSPTVLYSNKKVDRLARQHHTRNDTVISKAMGQNVARAVSVIDVDPSDYDKNKFYKSLVEFILPISSGVCKSDKLRELAFASPHFVLAQTGCSGAAGVSPKEIGLGDFKLVPLYTLNTEQGKLFDVARADVAANTLPMRAGGDVLTRGESELLKANMESLNSLQDLRIPDSDRNHTTKSIVTLSSLTADGVLDAYVKSLQAHKGKIGVTIDEHLLEDVMHDEEGGDVGAFVCVSVTARVN